MLILLLVLALLNATPAWHSHEHAHQVTQVAAAVDAQDGAPEDNGDTDACLECLIQAHQVAHLSDAPAPPLVFLQMPGGPLLAPQQQPPESPPAGRIRVRDPPLPIA
jgi:hypothetical protein